MANTLSQTVFQIKISGSIPERMIVQYTDENGEEKQVIKNHSELTTEQKAVFDSFKSLSESLIG